MKLKEAWCFSLTWPVACHFVAPTSFPPSIRFEVIMHITFYIFYLVLMQYTPKSMKIIPKIMVKWLSLTRVADKEPHAACTALTKSFEKWMVSCSILLRCATVHYPSTKQSEYSICTVNLEKIRFHQHCQAHLIHHSWCHQHTWSNAESRSDPDIL